MASVKREGWVNVFKDGLHTFVDRDVYDSKEQAIENRYDDIDYVNLIKIEWEE